MFTCDLKWRIWLLNSIGNGWPKLENHKIHLDSSNEISILKWMILYWKYWYSIAQKQEKQGKDKTFKILKFIILKNVIWNEQLLRFIMLGTDLWWIWVKVRQKLKKLNCVWHVMKKQYWYSHASKIAAVVGRFLFVMLFLRLCMLSTVASS